MIQALTAKRAHKPLRYEFARGDRTGVFITRVPFPAKTSVPRPSYRNILEFFFAGLQLPVSWRMSGAALLLPIRLACAGRQQGRTRPERVARADVTLSRTWTEFRAGMEVRMPGGPGCRGGWGA